MEVRGTFTWQLTEALLDSPPPDPETSPRPLSYGGDSPFGSADDLSIDFDGAPNTLPLLDTSIDVPLGASDEISQLSDIKGSLHAGPTYADLVSSAIVEILEACTEEGFSVSAVAICLYPGDVEYHALEHSVKRGMESSRAFRKRLISELRETLDSTFPDDCVDLLPMKDPRHTLAAISKNDDSFWQTVYDAVVSAGSSIELFADAELTLYQRVLGRYNPAHEADMTKDAQASDTNVPFTCLVRVTSDDMLFSLFSDGLRHIDQIASISIFDAPERVARRVLFEQDTLNVPRFDNILILAEEKETDLLRAFEAVFPDAMVSLAGERLPTMPEKLRSGHALGETLALISAVGALQTSKYEPGSGGGFPVGPRRNRRVRGIASLGAALATIASVVASLVVAHSCLQTYYRIAAVRAELRTTPAPANVARLEGRVDSLQALHAVISSAMTRRDSLIQQTAQWSPSLELVARETAEIGRVWVESWKPTGGTIKSDIEITGTAVDRTSIVEFATRLNASIQWVRFSEIRDAEVYTFSLLVPQKEVQRVSGYVVSLNEHATQPVLENAHSTTCPTGHEQDC